MPNSFILIFFIYHVCSNKSSYLYWHQVIYIISNLKLIPFSWKRLRHPFFSHFQCFYPIANPIWSELDQSSSAHKTVGSLEEMFLCLYTEWNLGERRYPIQVTSEQKIHLAPLKGMIKSFLRIHLKGSAENSGQINCMFSIPS